MSGEKRKAILIMLPVWIMVVGFAVYFVADKLAPEKPVLTVDGVSITLPDGYACSFRESDFSSWIYKGKDMKPGRVVFDTRIKGPNAQIFGSADEVMESCTWLEDLEIFENGNGVRMARGWNRENPDQPDRRYYVEGGKAVFLVSMVENPKYYDPEDCEKVMLAIAGSMKYADGALLSRDELKGGLKGLTAEQIVARMTHEQKALQMVQPACYNLSAGSMQSRDYGSILSQETARSQEYWADFADRWQTEALRSDTGIPYIYGEDDVHGVNYCLNAVIFPHNIGIGAANDEELTREMGRAVANEALLCHLPWNFAPCVAVSGDIRWGRTYESYGSDPDLVKRLGSAYVRGLTGGGVIACAKHFLGDGDVSFGTGEGTRLIDRGDARLSEREIEARMDVYRALIENGALTVMISHSSLNGVKMHGNGEYIRRLKEETGFKGFFISDWDSVQNIPGLTYEEQVILAVNSGIDMLMEVSSFEKAADIIVRAMESGAIPVSRVDDAVSRILYVKQQAGLFDDPFFENRDLPETRVGSSEYRALAERLVEKSLVLLKNENGLLPLKEGMTVYITGPAADDVSAQCGGWTVEWQGSSYVPGVTTLLGGFREVFREHDITVITDPLKADTADAVILCVGEKAYAEWDGDTRDPSLDGPLALKGNRDAMEKAAALGKPVITLIVAGRQVLLKDSDLRNWDSVVMCYLPGSEGAGVARVLTGEAPFTGRLPSPWYYTVDDLGAGDTVYRWPSGYGLE